MDSKVDRTTLRELLESRWPDSLPTNENGQAYPTGIAEFDRLFPLGGLPYGQLIEIGGGQSSGKTGFLFKLLTGLNRLAPTVYIDTSRSFYPAAAKSSGIDLDRLLVIDARDSSAGLRQAELLLDYKRLVFIVIDLINETAALSFGRLHRLRLKTVRARSLVFFLTERNDRIIPASMTSLKLAVERLDRHRVQLTAVKSRICREQITLDLTVA